MLFADRGDPIAVEPHPGGIIQIEPIRSAIDQQRPASISCGGPSSSNGSTAWA